MSLVIILAGMFGFEAPPINNVPAVGPNSAQVLMFLIAVAIGLHSVVWWGLAGLCTLALDCEEHLRTIKLQSLARKMG